MKTTQKPGFENLDKVAELIEEIGGVEEFRHLLQQASTGSSNGKIVEQLVPPTELQSALIHAKRPWLKMENPVVCTWLASHNMLSHDLGAWMVESLETMAQKFPAGRGRPLQVDHNWRSIEANRGFIFDARLIHQADAPEDLLFSIPGAEEHNQEIVDRNGGFYMLEIDTVMDGNGAAAQGIGTGSISECSIGGWATENLYCPICSHDYGEMVDFFKDERCPHIPPLPIMAWFYDFDNEEIRKILAPYYIRGEFRVALELSMVLAGNAPGSGLRGESWI